MKISRIDFLQTVKCDETKWQTSDRKSDMSMEMKNKKQRRAERKEHVLLKTWTYGVEMSHWGFSERAGRVCRTHPCLLIHPSAWCSLCIARCTLAALNTLIEARGPPRCFERLRAKTGWQTPRITRGVTGPMPKLQWCCCFSM